MKLNELLSHFSTQEVKANAERANEKAKKEATNQFIQDAREHMDTVITPTIKSMVKDLRRSGFEALLGERAMGLHIPEHIGWLSFSIRLRRLAWQLNVIVMPEEKKLAFGTMTNTRAKQYIELSLEEITPETINKIITKSLEQLLEFEAQIRD